MDDLRNKSFKLIIKTAISKTDKNAILLNLNSGSYFELNEVAYLIVQNLNDYINFKELSDLVFKNFEIDKDKCEQDVLSFLKNLMERDFLEVK